MKKVFILLMGLIACIQTANAFELDWSADEEIRKNYDTSKLENDVLPELPDVIRNPQPIAKPDYKVPKTSVSAPSTVPKENIETDFSTSKGNVSVSKMPHRKVKSSYSAIKIPKGTKFKVKSQTKLSDWNTAGARYTFVSTEPVVKRYVLVPAGTVFRGVIEDSHQPNFAGNGGLLKLKSETIQLNNSSRNIDAKVVRANNKKIFFNNIKGQRGYVKGIAANVDKGQQFYNKSRKSSTKLASNPVGVIISPIPTVVGAVGYCANLIVSPVTALWSKGSHISLPSGTGYTIKLRQDLFLDK